VRLPEISRDAENVLLGTGPCASFCRACDELDAAGYTVAADGEITELGRAKITDIKLTRQAADLTR